MRDLNISVWVERFPIAGTFTIARGTKTEAVVVVAEITDGVHIGRGEAVPYPRYGETVDGTVAAIAALGPVRDRDALRHQLPPGAARNAVDCALIDLEAKSAGRRAFDLLGLPEPGRVVTCYTLSLDTPQAMAARATAVPNLPLLKLKLGAPGDADRMCAVRAARPDARLVADANEGWTAEALPELFATAAACGLELIEQPVPAADDELLRGLVRPVPVCADESLHTARDLDRLAGLYDAVNIKLDKTGGLTEAIATVDAARAQGLRIMVGCMVATSLAMAPGLLLAAGADWVDLDGPLLLAADRSGGLVITNGIITPPDPSLWG